MLDKNLSIRGYFADLEWHEFAEYTSLNIYNI